jgi:hypothetical protein
LLKSNVKKQLKSIRKSHGKHNPIKLTDKVKSRKSISM